MTGWYCGWDECLTRLMKYKKLCHNNRFINATAGCEIIRRQKCVVWLYLYVRNQSLCHSAISKQTIGSKLRWFEIVSSWSFSSTEFDIKKSLSFFVGDQKADRISHRNTVCKFFLKSASLLVHYAAKNWTIVLPQPELWMHSLSSVWAIPGLWLDCTSSIETAHR